jgi:hypothetical protein
MEISKVIPLILNRAARQGMSSGKPGLVAPPTIFRIDCAPPAFGNDARDQCPSSNAQHGPRDTSNDMQRFARAERAQNLPLPEGRHFSRLPRTFLPSSAAEIPVAKRQRQWLRHAVHC